MSTFRILSLDGGGIRGTYTATVLAEIERRTSKRMVDHFDLITGTSTGGIIALAIAAGLPAANILDLYVNRGREIFPLTGIWMRAFHGFRRLFGTKFSQDDLGKVVESVLGSRTLGDLQCKVVVTAYNGDRNDLHRFRNFPPPLPDGHSSLPAVLVAQATAAAPTYFGAIQIPKGLPDSGLYLDGGMCANSPVLVGIIEAYSLEVPLDKITVLSIGTLYEKFRVDSLQRDGGIAQWGTSAFELLMHGQQACAVQLAENLVPDDRMVRVTEEKAEELSMDDIRNIDRLKEWGTRVLDQKKRAKDAETHLQRIERMFFQSKADWFQPFVR